MKPRLLFIKQTNFNARTVENDIAILSEKYLVKLYETNTTKGYSFYTAFIKQFFYLLFNIHRFKIIFIWFGDYHSFLPVIFGRIFGKKTYLCLGGYDAHWIIPDKPANFKARIRKFCVFQSVKKATMLFPVSNWLAGFVDNVADKNKIKVAYCCVDADKISSDNSIFEKENLILTVGGGGFLYETKRKKLDFFIETGNFFYRNFPDVQANFLLIGHNEGTETFNYLKKLIKSPNIKIIPVINDPVKLQIYFQRAKVYCQFSEYEAFGIAIIEAMLNKTIPIVNNGGAMPEVINGTGLIVENYNKEITANMIKNILDGKYDYLMDKARQRVTENFTIDNRKEILFQYL